MVRGDAEPVALTCERISANAAYALSLAVALSVVLRERWAYFLLPVATRQYQ